MYESGSGTLLEIAKGGEDMKKSVYLTNEAGVIKAPNPVKNAPSVSVISGDDLRRGQGK